MVYRRELDLLRIAPAVQEQAWEKSQQHKSTSDRYNAYINRICVKTFLEWFCEILAEDSRPQPAIWPKTNLASLLDVVNGTAIVVGETRLVLIPRNMTQPEELCVFQEWVDSPWAANYYLSFQIRLEADEDDCWMCYCGFATHRQLKHEAKYDPKERSYILPTEALFDKELLVMQLTLGLQMREEIVPLPVLSAAEAKALLQRLGNPAVDSPRLELDVPFEKWMALLLDPRCRQELYDRRLSGGTLSEAPLPEKAEPIKEEAPGPEKAEPINLRQWLRQVEKKTARVANEVWQAFETVITGQKLAPVRGSRSPISPVSAIAPLIRLTEASQPEQTRRNAAGVLGELGFADPEAIDALVKLLNTAREEETRWQAALSLGKISPGHPQAGVKKARLIDLGMQLAGHAIALVVAIMPKGSGKLGVYIQVHAQDQSKLPPDLELTVLTELGEPIPGLKISTRRDSKGESKDNSIQLRFAPPSGTCFQVRLALDDASIIEHFIA
ncbi:MAG: DUF1822 family protein [Oscillatoria sp. SIO1A7]|nr:DUF1822 family protein [Oscillatoria sp. SIO1A7]